MQSSKPHPQQLGPDEALLDDTIHVEFQLNFPIPLNLRRISLQKRSVTLDY